MQSLRGKQKYWNIFDNLLKKALSDITKIKKNLEVYVGIDVQEENIMNTWNSVCL